MAETVATKELNFSPSAGRQQSVSASAERIEIPPQNGSSFTISANSGQTIDLRLPSSMAKGHYLDFHNSYIKMSLNVPRGATDDATTQCQLSRNGIHTLIQKVEILSASSTISVIEDYHKLCSLFIDSESNSLFKTELGAVQYGMGADTVKGKELTGAVNTTKKTTFCFGLILTNLFSNTKYLPCFHNDNLVIRLTLGGIVDSFITSTAPPALITVNPVSMVCQIVKLSSDAQSLVEQMNNNIYSMVVDDWRNAKGVVAVADRSINQNLGFSNQSLSRVIFAFYNAPTNTSDSQGDRPHRHVNEYAFQLNGKNYPAQKIKANFSATDENHSEAIAEIRASTRQSGDFTQSGDIDPGSIVDGVGGRMFYEIDLEGLRANDQDSIYSGLYTVGGTTSLEVSMNADGAAQNTLNVWGQYQGRLVLDLNQGSTFTYSV